MTPQQGISFTIKQSGRASVLKSDVHIQPVNSSGSQSKYIAIWDTGAMSTVITPNVVSDLGLKPISYTQISTPSGTMQCGQYFVDLILPQNVIAQNVLVTEAIPSGCDALIGMDIIGHGDFAVTNYNGNTTFSFRVPSMQEIDFVSFTYSAIKGKAPGRNDMCPCGSGKKYKNCCGKIV